MDLKSKRIGVLVESDFYEPEINYYTHRFAEEGMQMDLLSRLWNQPGLTFTGHENRLNTIYCDKSFESIDPNDYAAFIVPSGMVSDRLRYTEDVNKIPPASLFLKNIFSDRAIVKGIICHGIWLAAPVPEIIRNRRVTVHNNLIGDAKAYGAVYVDEDVVVDDDLVTARTGNHCHLLARAILEILRKK